MILFLCRCIFFVVAYLAMKYLAAPGWAAVGIGLVLSYLAFPEKSHE